MRLSLVVAPALFLPIVAHAQSPAGTVRDVTFARDGRLAASIDGDLWLRDAGRRWRQITQGPSWDRHPAWSPDGTSLVFTSDREGQDDIWRIALTRNAPGALTRLTSDGAPELEPAVGPDGTIYFVRGRANDARLWQRTVTGEERRVTSGTTPERTPQVAPGGGRLAYVQQFDGGRRLRIRRLGTTEDSVVTAERNPERFAWSPDGERLAFTTGTPRPALYVTPPDGRYVNYVVAARGDVAWSPDGQLLVAERLRDEPGYNGDPDRVGDRARAEQLTSREKLVWVAAPAPPPARSEAVIVDAAIDRRNRNRETFDRFAQRMERTYYAASPQKMDLWRGIVNRLRPQAESAPDDDALAAAMHKTLRDRPTLRDEAVGKSAVSSAHPVATAAGVEMLQRGGNVVDAAVAVSFALGVVEPDASGIGGYGQMLVHLKGMAQPVLLDFMARVPEEGGLANAALLVDGRYPSDGPMVAMVPGTVAAMHTAWKRFGSGKVPWADLVAPAIRAAREGYMVSDGLATTLWLERDRFFKYESSRALFFKDGKPRTAGDTIRNADLAWTLDQIARRGSDGFYRGDVAQRLVADLRGKGNAIRLTDLSRYFAAERTPVQTTYRGHTVYGSAPPVSGGATLAAQLNALEQAPALKSYTDDAATLHAMITAWQLLPSSRNRIADPALWPTDITPFVSKDTARARWRCFDPARALTPTIFRGDTLSCATTAPSAGERSGDEAAPYESVQSTEPCNVQDHARGAECRAQGTTSFAVADADGNAVAVTQTLGTWGGNFYVTPGLGFLYNDKLTSYGTDPNAYGARLPFARHGSTISPTLVFQGDGHDRRLRLALGAAGNAWINSAVYQTLVGVIDFGLSPQRALELPRFLPSQRGAPGAAALAQREYVVDIEDGIDPAVVRRLEEMGHRFNRISLPGELRMGYGAAIAVGTDDVRAGADPRRAGAAGAVPR
jgi:gamma-glutamyltranspeptidase